MLICVYPQPVMLDKTSSLLMTNVFPSGAVREDAHSDHIAFTSMIKSFHYDML